MLGAVARRSSLCVGFAHCLRPVIPRITSACPQHTSPGQGCQKQPLKQWALSVSPYTRVRAQLVSCNISVSPLDPHAFPEADRAFITVTGGREGQESALDLCQVHYDEESRELWITGGAGSSKLSIDLEAPIKSELFISTEGSGHVHISKMECDICKVTTQEGNCTLHSIRAHQVEVRSSGGCVTGLGTIHGNVHIVSSGESAVDVKKLQGTTMNVSTEHGSLKVKAVYAESSNISSCTGKVELGHVHGNATVKNESGDTIIDGSNSFTQVSSHSGDIDLYVGDGGSAVVLSEEGAVCVRVPSTLRAAVELCGASVDISPEVVFHEAEKHQAPGQTTVLGFINAESQMDPPHLKAQTKTGSVKLKTQSWFESLKLRS
ncbi:protein FAM185A [Eucyclogobius newberryi]|uniref:protein FAM185A n=1 Tax=Eucyclogobius newberryi TaxID=166745 RepID=UPI003B59E4B4